MVSATQPFFRFILLVTAICLLANDLVRVVCILDTQQYALQTCDAPQQDSNDFGIFSLLDEEDAKHHHATPSISVILFPVNTMETSVAHLISDDNVRHLAYMPIFSPPPDLV
jgi:hypothetical protein